MSGTLTAIIAFSSGIAGVILTLVAARYQWRKDGREQAADRRDQAAADDIEADRIIALKDKRIEELERRVECLQSDFDALAAKVRMLEAKLDQYGCWNAPHCGTWRPLSGPRPADI